MDALQSKLEPVRIARTREEREAIYSFRYAVYYLEYGRSLSPPDHERQWVTDEEDEKITGTLLYTGTPEEITGTVRIRHWPPDKVPEKDFDELSMDLFPGIERLGTAEIGRLMIRRDLPGKLLIASLLCTAYELLADEHQAQLVFFCCPPALIQHYRRFGGRPFGGRPVHAADGVMVPLVNVVSDLDYHQREGSLLAPLVRQRFGKGKREPLDLEPYRQLLEKETTPVVVDPEELWAELQRAFVDDSGETPSFFDWFPDKVVRQFTDKGFIIEVAEGTSVTRSGAGEDEMYLILDGLFEAVEGGRRLRVMGKGELFGELAFFLPGHRRTASVRALADGRLLVLHGRTISKMIALEPKTAARLLLEIGRLMAQRLASLTTPVGENEQTGG